MDSFQRHTEKEIDRLWAEIRKIDKEIDNVSRKGSMGRDFVKSLSRRRIDLWQRLQDLQEMSALCDSHRA